MFSGFIDNLKMYSETTAWKLTDWHGVHKMASVVTMLNYNNIIAWSHLTSKWFNALIIKMFNSYYYGSQVRSSSSTVCSLVPYIPVIQNYYVPPTDRTMLCPITTYVNKWSI